MNVTFAQTLAPISAATVSSLMMGFAWGTGGLSVPFVGMLADRIGIEQTLTTMAFVPLARGGPGAAAAAGKQAHIGGGPRRRRTRKPRARMLLRAARLEETGSMRSTLPVGTQAYSDSFGPGPLTPAIKMLIIANVVVFLLSLLSPAADVLLPRPAPGRRHRTSCSIWQLVTYMFLHGGIFHLLFNMLTLWMFGVELERMWGTRFFTKYYFVTGVGAAATTDRPGAAAGRHSATSCTTR